MRRSLVLGGMLRGNVLETQGTQRHTVLEGVQEMRLRIGLAVFLPPLMGRHIGASCKDSSLHGV